jgi:hypothetical protein
MKPKRSLLLACGLLFSVMLGLGCSGDQKGGLNLDQTLGERQNRLLRIETAGDITLVALKLPFRSDKSAEGENVGAIFSDVLLEDGPAETHLEYSVNSQDGTVTVALMNGQENGFNGQHVTLRFDYTTLDKRNPIRPPCAVNDIERLKALDTSFHNQTDRIILSWLEEQKEPS